MNRKSISQGRGKGILATLSSVTMLTMALALLVVGGTPARSLASSHREAPFISSDPEADNTDLYAFVSPDVTNTVTIIANYLPLEEPNGGPNFGAFGDNVQYEIRIDNTGNGEANVVYQFRFNTVVGNENTFLYATSPITSIDSPNWNFKQFYTVTRIANGVSTMLGANLKTPPVNIGPRSTPNYDALAASAVNSIGSSKFFAGQRDDPFYVDLGSIFDLGGLRPFNQFHLVPLSNTVGIDGLKGYNVHTIAIQVPMTDLTRDGQPPNTTNGTIGIYANASRQSTRVLRTNGTQDVSGNFVQISRLGNPLINEVVIHHGQKDYWNSQPPASDKQYLNNYLTPELTGLENLLYASVISPANTTNRQDLVGVLLTGLPGIPGVLPNYNYTGNTKADLLRLNMTIPVSTNPTRLSVLDTTRDASTADLQGFPNGRRLADDVVDIELRATAEGYGPVLHALYGVPDRMPNDALGDGVDTNDKPFLTTFPYVAGPWAGYDPTHHNVATSELRHDLDGK
ncbi:MAG: DUF4331 domain-containing protein [Chloroflexota bacterium]|nr:DUF4331 domain-containing protein [Chloroflexota bacterium]